MMHNSSVDLLWVSAGLCLVLLAHQESWSTGEASPQSSLRTGTTLLGELFLKPPAVVVAAGLLKQGPKTNSENISLSPVST